MIAIELNDAGILVARNRQVVLESPGYALLEKDRLVIGHEARKHTQTKPRLINKGFWEKLGLEPLAYSLPEIATNADLVREHLAHIASQIEEEEAILAVPPTFKKDQLGLVLGIAKQLSIPVSGMIDSALAAAKPDISASNLIYLDIQLSRIVLTVLQQGAKVVRHRYYSFAGSGLFNVHEAWLKLIAGQFIQQTRFDPLHHGASAQRLYECLPDWFETITRDTRSVLEFAGDEQVYRITLRHEHWETIIQSLFEGVIERIDSEVSAQRSSSIQISHRLSILPGFIDCLQQRVDCEIEPLERGAAPLGALRLADHIISSKGQSVALTLSIPSIRQPHVRMARLRPSHIVLRGQAYPLQPDGLVLCRVLGSLDLHLPSSAPTGAEILCSIKKEATDVRIGAQPEAPVLINDMKAAFPAQLYAGDMLVYGGDKDELLAICLVSPSET